MFDDTELAEIAASKPQAGDDKLDALGLARAWQLHVEKIDNDRAPRTTTKVYGPSTTWLPACSCETSSRTP
jgi:hypothetical protein